MPKFSIITINRNKKKDLGLEKTLESVISQDFTDFEYIVVDGASTDGSIDIIKKHSDHITKWISEVDSGIYEAMNKGIKMATGEYLLFLNSGDYLCTKSILSTLATYKFTKQVYFGNLVIVGQEDSTPFVVDFGGMNYNLDFFRRYALPHQATIFRRSVFEKFGTYDESYRYCGDHEYFLRLMKHGVKFNHLPVAISMYDNNGVSNNPQLKGTIESEKNRMFALHFGNPPIHFLTIVLNGFPLMPYHIEVFKKLPFEWHWHIVEGLAELKNDTSWSLATGGRIPEKMHKQGRSIDETTAYIDELKKTYPNNISVYRKPLGKFWNGKLEMVNAPLKDMTEEAILFQIDSDELWTFEQICRARDLFISSPKKIAAYFLCYFFVGKDLVLSNLKRYGNSLQQDWLRMWRYSPGFVWASHEPPKLCRVNPDQSMTDIATENCFSHLETASAGIIFQHYNYVTRNQLEFKEQYYGLANVYNLWKKLQKVTVFPVYLKDYFQWVNDNTTVKKVSSFGIKPIAQFDENEECTFDFSEHPLSTIEDNMTYSLVQDLLAKKQVVTLDPLNNATPTTPDANYNTLSPKGIHKLRRLLFPPHSRGFTIIRKIYQLIHKQS